MAKAFISDKSRMDALYCDVCMVSEKMKETIFITTRLQSCFFHCVCSSVDANVIRQKCSLFSANRRYAASI